MKALLETYSLTDILLFIVAMAVAIKAVSSFSSWAYEGLSKFFGKQSKKKQALEDTESMKVAINSIKKSIDILIASDKDDIKAFIVEKHQTLCGPNSDGTIHHHTLDCIERRYSHYLEENGNSYVEDLMKDIRALKKI